MPIHAQVPLISPAGPFGSKSRSCPHVLPSQPFKPDWVIDADEGGDVISPSQCIRKSMLRCAHPPFCLELLSSLHAVHHCMSLWTFYYDLLQLSELSIVYLMRQGLIKFANLNLFLLHL
jgi:hypothetical protein